MKRTLDCTDSLGALMSICPAPPGSEDQVPNMGSRQLMYGNNGREFQSTLELEEDDSGGCVWGEKKRRLSVEQVKALEKSFEVENKLEPDRKVKLAQDLGLQPRQVAVWFQNRRARWKTKQLERDYGVLKANYDSLQLKYEGLHHDNDSLLKEIKELKSKLKIESELDDDDDKETNGGAGTGSPIMNSPLAGSEAPLDLNFEGVQGSVPPAASIFTDVKDGCSDSDSSAILNEAGDGAAATSLFHGHHHQFMAPPSMINFGCGGGGANFMSESEETEAAVGAGQKGYQPQFVKVEEYNFFSGEEACHLFSDEQAPTLPWYCPTDQW